ncbi:GNAT family N-acetyltransferase [soil metagenome]
MAEETVETVVTYLEMTAQRFTHVPMPAGHKIMLVRLDEPTIEYYRYLYDAVGRKFTWIDRKKISDDELAQILATAGVEVWVLYVGGVPAGYFEVNATGKEAVDIAYFGLIAHFHGRGLGKWLLAEAIKACWAHDPPRITVNTCTLDGPRALPLYQKMGFVPVKQVRKMVVLPRG